MFIAAKPSEAVVNYIDLHPKEGQDYIALKFIDSVTKAPITTGISCWFSSSVKTIVTDYQGIAHISGIYDLKVVIWLDVMVTLNIIKVMIVLQIIVLQLLN